MRKQIWNQILFGIIASIFVTLPVYGEEAEQDQVAQGGSNYGWSRPQYQQRGVQEPQTTPDYTEQQRPSSQPQYSNGNGTQQRRTAVNWETDYAQALRLAKKQNKPIVLYFTGSDWCGWCKKLDSEVLTTSEFNSVAGDKFIFVKLDFPREEGRSTSNLAQQNNDLKQKFGVSGFPTIVILDPNGNFVAETGYRPGGGREFAYYLLQFFPQQQ